MSGNGASRQRVAVVIGSGSVKCAAALGLQRALQRAEIDVDLVVGCSGGSLYAATMALGYGVDEIVATTKRLWTRDVTGKKDRRALLGVVMPKLFGFSKEWGLRDDSLILDRLRKAFGDATFADTKVPLYLTATDFDTGEQVILEEGSLVQAMRASIAIPFLFKPWRIGDRLLMDGYVSDPLPINVAIREGADIILALGFEIPAQREVNSAGRFAFQFSALMTNNLLKAKYAFHNLAHHAEMIPITPEFKERIRLFDTEKIPYIIDEGERAAEKQMPYIKRLLAARSE